MSLLVFMPDLILSSIMSKNANSLDLTTSNPMHDELANKAIHQTSIMATYSLTLRAVFHGLDDATVNDLKQIGKMTRYAAGTVLITQGEIGDRFFILMDGRVAITKDQEGAPQLMLGVIGPGKYFGEMSLLDNVPRTATCTAMTKVIVLEITKNAFNSLVKHSPQLAYAVMYQILTNHRRDEENALAKLVEKAEELEEAYTELRQVHAQLVQHERVKREIEIAGEVQRNLLPKQLPNNDRFDFSAYIGSTRAGADFYDVIQLDENHIGVLLGDVGDHGLHASLYMTMARTLFRVESRRSLSPVDVIQAVHRGMLDVSTINDMFVKAFYGVINCQTGLLTYAIAGQERPYLYRPGKGIAQLKGKGNYLGLTRTIHVEERKIRLRPGDQIVLFNNGLVSVVNQDGEPFEKERLLDVIKRNHAENADGLLNEILDALRPWGAGTEVNQEEQLALLVTHVSNV